MPPRLEWGPQKPVTIARLKLCPWNTRRELYQKVGNFVGSVRSPLLANVYLHELDCFVTTLADNSTKGKARKHNLAYRALRSRAVRLNRRIDQETDPVKRQALIECQQDVHREMPTMPSKDQYDSACRRLRYCRYADDFA